MGTRNLTCVYLDGEYKVSQYGQWDGYPEGQGVTCLNFLRDTLNEEKFKEKLRKMKFASKDYINGIYAAFGAKDGFINIDGSHEVKKRFPQFHRDTAADILEMIATMDIGPYLEDDINFAGDSLFCEWAYVIDLDKRTFEVYEGFNQKPLTEEDRFFFLEEKSYKEHRDEDQYHPVKLVKSWSLDELPTEEEFINAFKEEEEE